MKIDEKYKLVKYDNANNNAIILLNGECFSVRLPKGLEQQKPQPYKDIFLVRSQESGEKLPRLRWEVTEKQQMATSG